ALTVKEYTMSGQKDEFAVLEKLQNDSGLSGLKTEIIGLDVEIGDLNRQVNDLQKRHRLSKTKSMRDQPTNNIYKYITGQKQMYDDEKAKKYKKFKTVEVITNPLEDKHVEALFKNREKLS